MSPRRFPRSDDRRVGTDVFVVAVTLVVSLFIAVALPFYATETEAGAETCTSGMPEGSEAFVDGWSWWLIGSRCVLIENDGTRHEEVVPPWRGDAWSDEDL